jgi:hypothetical protein
VQVVAQGRALVDGGAAVGALVKLVYTGEDRRNQPYVAEGKVYFFGNNDHRRVNAVPARVLPQFLDPAGRYYGSFVAFDPTLHAETGDQRLETGDGESEGEAQGVPPATPSPVGSEEALPGPPAAPKRGGKRDG